MKEWFKKYFGLLGFGACLACFLFSALEEFVFKTDLYDNSLIGMIGFLIMITAQLIQDILMKSILQNILKKLKRVLLYVLLLLQLERFVYKLNHRHIFFF